jgi:hypothetical protein
VVDRIDDVDDGMAVTIVFWPNGPDPALASEIPELEHGRGQRYLPGCYGMCACMTLNAKVASEE